VIVRPDAVHSVSTPSAVVAPMRAVTVLPRASGIWLARVRCQMASWASWAFFDFLAYVRGPSVRYSRP
jgi:hypothetical protein